MREIHCRRLQANVLINPRHIVSIEPYSRETGEPQMEKCTKLRMTNSIYYILTGLPVANAYLLQ